MPLIPNDPQLPVDQRITCYSGLILRRRPIEFQTSQRITHNLYFIHPDFCDPGMILKTGDQLTDQGSHDRLVASLKKTVQQIKSLNRLYGSDEDLRIKVLVVWRPPELAKARNHLGTYGGTDGILTLYSLLAAPQQLPVALMMQKECIRFQRGLLFSLSKGVRTPLITLRTAADGYTGPTRAVVKLNQAVQYFISAGNGLPEQIRQPDDIFTAANTLICSYNNPDQFKEAYLFRDAVSVLESDQIRNGRPEHHLQVRPITGCNFLFETVPPQPSLRSAASIVQSTTEREPLVSEHLTSVSSVLNPPAGQSAEEQAENLRSLSQTYAAAGETGRAAAELDVAAVVAGAVAASQGSQQQVQQTLQWLDQRYGSDSMQLQQQLQQAEQDRRQRRQSEASGSSGSASGPSASTSRSQSTSRSATPQSPLQAVRLNTGPVTANVASVSVQSVDQLVTGSIHQMVEDIVAGRRPGTIQILINNWQQQTGQQVHQPPSSN